MHPVRMKTTKMSDCSSSATILPPTSHASHRPRTNTLAPINAWFLILGMCAIANSYIASGILSRTVNSIPLMVIMSEQFTSGHGDPYFCNNSSFPI